MISSYLKCFNSKEHILDKIYKYVPEGTKLFYDVFGGSGVVGFNAPSDKVVISDLNNDIYSSFNHLKTHGEKFINDCKELFIVSNNKEDPYYKLRHIFNTTNDDYLRAKIFVYLNHHAINAITRYSKSSGKFNVPCGEFANPIYFPEIEMKNLINPLQDIVLASCDFRILFDYIKTNSVVYCDPPYYIQRRTAYANSAFTLRDHQDLVKCAEDARKRGNIVILSNYWTSVSKDLYKNASHVDVFPLYRRRGRKPNTKDEALIIYR